MIQPKPQPLPQAQWRDRLADFLSRPLTEKLLIALILINAITLGLETYLR